jgi:arylsulfatase A-like enzyme
MNSKPLSRREWLGASLCQMLSQGRAESAHPPNFVLIFTDDLGYNDLSCYGSALIQTPRLDTMAREGVRFTQFYAQPVCGPSRAALLTGCYPPRIAEPGNRKRPHTELHSKEVTIPKVLKPRGYRSACIGKWHAGLDHMPRAQGFDYFFGTPLYNGVTRYASQSRFLCELMRNEEVIERPAAMDTLTSRYVEEAVRFIRENRRAPFFLYLAHNMPHVPLGVSPAYRGRSRGGLYGDAVEEIDAGAGRVLDTLKEFGLDRKTLVLFTSDNGPWIEAPIGEDAGSAYPLRGAKMTTWEGGLRVPFIARWPGKLPAGQQCDRLATTMDFLPTMSRLAGAELPGDRIIDGKDIFPLLSNPVRGDSPHDVFYYYCFTHLQAVRSGPWKLVLRRPANPPWTAFNARMIDRVAREELYHLEKDPGEKRDVALEHPEQVSRLLALAERARDELGDYDRVGRLARFFDGPVPATSAERDGR